MTRDILQSDVQFAIRLTNENLAEAEVIQALVRRGIDPAKAAELVNDLRAGKPVSFDSTAALEFTPRRRSRSRSSSSGTQEKPSLSSAETTSRRERPAPSAARRRKSPLFWKLFAVLVVLALLVVGLVVIVRHQNNNILRPQSEAAAATPPNKQTRPGTPGYAARTEPAKSAAQLVLELQPDGLYLSGRNVTRENLLPAVVKLLGAPSRTNRVAQTGAIIYAYDRQGLLIYTQPGGGTTGIVLDCEATGGNAGTTSAFAGQLKVEDTVISPDTDSQTLTAIKKLPLNRRGRTSNVLTGRYGSFELVFAYVRSNQRLSLVEIDLK